jgi:hypothetical protein
MMELLVDRYELSRRLEDFLGGGAAEKGAESRDFRLEQPRISTNAVVIQVSRFPRGKAKFDLLRPAERELAFAFVLLLLVTARLG